MMMDSINQTNIPIGFHNTLYSKFSSKDNFGPYQIILEELSNKTKQFNSDSSLPDNKVKIFYFTFLIDFIKNRKKYQLQKKLDCLYDILRKIVEIDMADKQSTLPSLFQQEKQFREILLNDFTDSKKLNLNEVLLFDLLLKYTVFTKEVEKDNLLEKFKKIFFDVVFNRKGDLYSKSVKFINIYLFSNTKSSENVKEDFVKEITAVLETFRINDNKTIRTLDIIKLIFSELNTDTKNKIHSLLNNILESGANKQIKLKVLSIMEQLGSNNVMDFHLTEKSLSCLTNLREENLFLMLDGQFIKTYLRAYLQLLLNLNMLSSTRAQENMPVLVSLSLDILFEVDNFENKGEEANEAKKRNIYRLKRDCVNVISVLIENTVNNTLLVNKSNNGVSLEDLLANLNLKKNTVQNKMKSPLSRLMALLLYTVNVNFCSNYKFIDKVLRAFINKMNEIGAFKKDTEIVKNFVNLLYHRLKDTMEYEGREELMTLLISRVDYLFKELTNNIPKNLANEDFTYILLLVGKYCSELDFDNIGLLLFNLSNDLIKGYSSSGANSDVFFKLIKSLGKFKRFSPNSLNQYQQIINSLMNIIFDGSVHPQLKKPFYDLLQNYLAYCVHNKNKLNKNFFDYLVVCCKENLLFGNICKEILNTDNPLYVYNENVLKLLVVLLPDEYILPMLVNNTNNISSRLEQNGDLPAESKIIIITVEAVGDIHTKINLFESVLKLVDLLISKKTDLSTAMKILTSLSKNVNEVYFRRVNELFSSALEASKQKKDSSIVKSGLNFMKSTVQSFSNNSFQTVEVDQLLEEYLDFIFSNFKNRNTKTRLIVREIIESCFRKYKTIEEDNRLFAIILSGLATDKSKTNFIEVLNFVVKKRFYDFNPSLMNNIFEILLLMLLDKNKSVFGVLLKLLKTLCKKSREELLFNYIGVIFNSLQENNPELISSYREKIKKIFKILIKRFVG